MSNPTYLRPFRVHVHGIASFSRQLSELLSSAGWNVRNYGVSGAGTLTAKLTDLSRADLVFTYGGRVTLGKFFSAARLLDKERVVVFWAGSDILYARRDFAAGRVDPWLASRIHWAASPWIAEEVREIGIPCEYVPINWAAVVSTPAPLPEKMSVLVYMPELERGELYGLDHFLRVARALPSIDFRVVGFRDRQFPEVPANVQVHGWEKDMTRFYEQSTLLWRPVRHDGMSFMVLSALAHGRHVLWTYPFPACVRTEGATEAKLQLERLHALHQAKQLPLNEAGMKLIANNFSREKTRERIHRRWELILNGAELSLERPEIIAQEKSATVDAG